MLVFCAISSLVCGVSWPALRRCVASFFPPLIRGSIGHYLIISEGLSTRTGTYTGGCCGRPLRPALLLPFAIVDTEKLQFAVQSRPFHPDKARCTRDIAGKTTYLNLQIFAFEALPRFTQGRALDCRVAHQIGRAHVSTPVTNAHLVCRLLPTKKHTYS